MMEWLLIFFTIYVSGFLSGAEIAFVTANRLKIELILRKKGLAADYLGRYVANPDRFLVTLLLGNNAVNVIYATLMTLFLGDSIISMYQNIMGNEPTSTIVLILQSIITSVVILIFGETIPKVVFKSRADFIIKSISIPIRILEITLTPFIYIANSVSSWLLKALKVENQKTVELFRRQDIAMIIEEIHTQQATDLDQDETELLSNVLELSSKRVRDSMITRTEIVGLEKDTPVEDALKVFISSGYSKLPVYDETIDSIIGVIFAADLFKRPKTLTEIQRSIQFIPSSKKSKDLLTEFRKTNTSMAIVLDEYGGTAGLVTIEDLIEEVVGDIEDEYDTTDHLMKKLNQHTFVFSGMAEIEDVVEKFPELEIPESDEYETIAGYIIHHTDRIPRVNEEIIIDNKKCIISKASPARIEIVRIVLLEHNV